mgnify:CR=1 FL=1
MSLPTDLTLLTPRLCLRQPYAADVPPIFAATRVPGFNDGMTWDPPPDEGPLYDHLDTILARWQRGEAYVFSITDRAQGTLLGRISIRRLTGATPSVWDVGAFTLPQHQGQGIMSEALRAVLAFGFEQLQATRIEACHARWNQASERVLRKQGFRFVRYVQHGFQKNGQWVAENLLALDRATWQQGLDQPES